MGHSFKMRYLGLLLNSARQAIANKISWLYIFASLMGQLTALSSPLSELIPSIKSISSETWLLSTVLSMIFTAGLVYSVSQKELHNIEISILEGWRKGWSKIIQIGLLTILLLAILFVVIFVIGVIYKKLISFGILRTLIIALFIRPILNFGTCALVINNCSILASVRVSVSMFMRNAFQTLAVSGMLIIIQQVLLSILVLLFMNPYSGNLFGSPFKIFDIPQVVFWDQVLSLILSPWIVIIFTHLFMQFDKESEMAILSSSQDAA
jgi:hypothetical protein